MNSIKKLIFNDTYLAVAFVFFLTAALLNDNFAVVDSQFHDFLFRLRGMQTSDPRITIATIDDESIKKIGQYPWPRRHYTKLIDNLFSLNVALVGLDVLFLDKSGSPDDDYALMEVINRHADRVIQAIDIDPAITETNVFRLPFKGLKKVVKHWGVVDQQLIDSDGIIRRSSFLVGTNSHHTDDWMTDPNRQPTFAATILSLFLKTTPDELAKKGNIIEINYPGEETTYRPVANGKTEKVPRYGILRIPIYRLMSNGLTDAEKRRIKGGIVLVGSTTIGAFDHFPSPFTPQMPGVEVHASVIDNVLNNRALRGLPHIVTLLLMVLFTTFSMWVVNLNPILAGLSVLATAGVWFYANYFMFVHLYVLDFWASTLSLLVPFAYSIVKKTRAEQQRARNIKQTFSQYVAPEVVNLLVKNPPKLGGEKREMTVFFLDIAHFTNISEKMDPEALIHFLNFYLTGLTDVIHKNKGVVDKYIGDCIMAFWNAPVSEPKHRGLACLSAVECIQTVERLNQEFIKNGNMPERPAIRVGVNSGVVTVGNTGSKQKLQYTVIGDEVNLASRLEGANKYFGSKVCVSEACYKEAKDDVDGRELGTIRVIGKAVPIRVFEPLARKGELSVPWKKALPIYEKAMKVFREAAAHCKGDAAKAGPLFAEAKKLFAQVLVLVPEDSPSKLYFNRCEDYSVIPPAGWDGIDDMRTK